MMPQLRSSRLNLHRRENLKSRISHLDSHQLKSVKDSYRIEMLLNGEMNVRFQKP